MTAKTILFALLAALGAVFVVGWFVGARRPNARPPAPPDRADPADPADPRRRQRTGVGILIGAVTDFLDTLGVGSFATTTSLFKLGRVVADEDIPGTLNVGHTLPTLLEAFIYIAVVDVEIKTLVGMIAAATAGAYWGAGVVARWPRRKLQLGMGGLLLVAAVIIVLRQTALVPGGGTVLGVAGTRLAVGIGGNFALGALMTLGIGLYAPCMILVSLLGMNPLTAFPIMMGSCAFLMPVASLRFIRSGRVNHRAALGLTAGGIPGVLVAALIVKSLSLEVVQWLVVAVVVYTAAAMLNSARGAKNAAGAGRAPSPDSSPTSKGSE
ncbi:MAG: TSUP family transporter [Verrucomicrobiota bacterium]